MDPSNDQYSHLILQEGFEYASQPTSRKTKKEGSISLPSFRKLMALLEVCVEYTVQAWFSEENKSPGRISATV